MAARIAARLLEGDLAGRRLPVELGRERVVLVERGDLAAPIEQQRAVAHAHPLDALSPEGDADERAAHAGEDRRFCHLVGDRQVGGAEGVEQAPLRRTALPPEGCKELLAGEAAGDRAASVPAHAVGEHGEHRRRIRIGRAGAHGCTRPRQRGVLLVAARTLRGTEAVVQFLHQSRFSAMSDQSNSAPQNGTNTSCVRPIVMTSMCCSSTAAVGRASFTETTLVFARFGTNRNERSLES